VAFNYASNIKLFGNTKQGVSKNKFKIFFSLALANMVIPYIFARMRDRNKEIISIRVDEDLKDHIKAVAKPNVNAWIVARLKKASGYATKGKLR